MKVRNFLKALMSAILIIALVVISTGCGNAVRSVMEDDLEELDFDASDVTSLAAQDYIRFTIEDDLQEAYPGYNVDYVECMYLSQEYVEELYYNSLNNVYFGYDYDEVASYMQDKNWAFTVDENGQTVVTEVKEPSNALVDIVKKVAIGTGVILVCAVISVATGGAGAAPVACFFAGAAKGAMIGAVTGSAVSGVIGGAIEGIRTKSWKGALNGALNAAADGFMWGAIGGALTGGFKSTACFSSDTLVKTDEGYKQISEIEVGDNVYSYNEAAQLYEYKPVSHISKKTASDIVKVTVGENIITTTSTHPFYTQDGWTEASKLTEESVLLTNDGYVKPSSVEVITADDEIWVHNLTVAYNHTYTVSTDDVVVHNACGDSVKLRKNLIESGEKAPDYPNAAHHIVPSSDHRYKASIQAQKKLESLGIGINDASNGVFLSTSKSVAGTTYHRTLHTNAYYEKVYDLLRHATNKQEGIEVLSYIKQSLADGTFMP